MPLDLPPPLNKNGILQIMKAKYNGSISNLSNDISKHLIVLFIFINQCFHEVKLNYCLNVAKTIIRYDFDYLLTMKC